MITPERSHYKTLETDEFWTYVGNKKQKYGLIYAYDRETKEIVSYVWGKRDVQTAKKLRKKLSDSGVEFDHIYTDNRESFAIAFKNDNHITDKKYMVGIEGNNCLLKHGME